MKLSKYNYLKWVCKETKILVIIGISGVGKTTLSEKIQAESEDVKLVSFDTFIYDNPSKYKRCEIVDAFFLKYPDLLKVRNTIEPEDDDYFKYFKKCIDFIVDDCLMTGEYRVVLEGAQFSKPGFLDYVEEKYNQLPSLIILDISSFRATIRVYKRGLIRRKHLRLIGRVKFLFRVLKNNYIGNVIKNWELHKSKIYIEKKYSKF